MAGLPWIQVAVGTPDHPKLLALALELGIDRVQAVGHAVVLWTSIGRLAPHGGLSAPHADQVLERMAGWTGEPGRFAAAAVACGLVDRTETGLCIHDWDDHAGAFVEKFRRDAERQRKRRADAKRPADVQRTSTLRPSDVQREREREREIEKKPSPAAPAAAEAESSSTEKPKDQRHAEAIAAFKTAFEAVRPGVAWRPSGADVKQLKTMLAYPDASLEEIRKRIAFAFEDGWFRQHGTLALFASKWPTWTPATPTWTKGRAPVEQVNWEGKTTW